MARIVYIRNPAQPDDCLSGAMGAYIRRIPPRFATFSEAVQHLSRAKFQADDGKSGDDRRCYPAQRARVWPSTFNCWEATAHIAAEGARLLPKDWIIYVNDQNYGVYRHVWVTLELPGLLGAFRPPANLSGNDILGGVHVAGKLALSVFGAGAVGDILEGVEGEALPEWARSGRTGAAKKQDDTATESAAVEKPTAKAKKAKDTPQGSGINDPI